ncbi:hypothetical protein BH09BAC6_BH09BAC6_12200 [soil metagenome]|jgi:hypothetical protein
MQTTYLALLEDERTIITKTSFDLIKAIPDSIKYIFRMTLDQHVKVGLNEGDLFTYTSVDFENNYNPIDLTNFLIVDLGTDYFGKYASERYTVVKEKRTGERRRFHSVGDASSFILYFLIPLINKLENGCSWEIIDKFKELEEIKKENEQLKAKIRGLEGGL